MIINRKELDELEKQLYHDLKRGGWTEFAYVICVAGAVSLTLIALVWRIVRP